MSTSGSLLAPPSSSALRPEGLGLPPASPAPACLRLPCSSCHLCTHAHEIPCQGKTALPAACPPTTSVSCTDTQLLPSSSPHSSTAALVDTVACCMRVGDACHAVHVRQRQGATCIATWPSARSTCCRNTTRWRRRYSACALRSWSATGPASLAKSPCKPGAAVAWPCRRWASNGRRWRHAGRLWFRTMVTSPHLACGPYTPY